MLLGRGSIRRPRTIHHRPCLIQDFRKAGRVDPHSTGIDDDPGVPLLRVRLRGERIALHGLLVQQGGDQRLAPPHRHFDGHFYGPVRVSDRLDDLRSLDEPADLGPDHVVLHQVGVRHGFTIHAHAFHDFKQVPERHHVAGPLSLQPGSRSTVGRRHSHSCGLDPTGGPVDLAEPDAFDRLSGHVTLSQRHPAFSRQQDSGRQQPEHPPRHRESRVPVWFLQVTSSTARPAPVPSSLTSPHTARLPRSSLRHPTEPIA